MYRKDSQRLKKKKQGREIVFPSKQKARTGLQGTENNAGHANTYHHHQKRGKKIKLKCSRREEKTKILSSQMF